MTIRNPGLKPTIPAPDGFYGCPACGEIKPVSEFHKTVRGPGGHASFCKPCAKLKREAYKRSRSVDDPTAVARFWKKVAKGKPQECWPFTAKSDRKGYGAMSYHGQIEGAHRVSWLIAGHTLTPGMVIDHICRNTRCVNPHHLRLVTPEANVHAGLAVPAINARKTHCKQGHEYTPGNTAKVKRMTGKTRHGHPRQSPTKGRVCLTCHPYLWRYAIIKRGPSGPRGSKLPWLGPQW